VTSRARAVRYARALFDVVLKEGDPQRVEAELGAFAAAMTEHGDLGRVLAHPAMPAARKRAIVEALLEKTGAMTPAFAKMLRLLAERDRLALLHDIADAYRERLLQHQRIVRAEVTTAVPVPADRLSAIEQGLAAATGRKVTIIARVDPSIIGGAVARIGSTVYDGSVTRQLERLRERLAEGQVERT
jgi:F-type H+-transporting ATPase subunit delta